MRVLIAGSGYVGTALGNLLLATGGHEVFGLRRDPSKLPPGIRPVAADLSRPLPPDALPPNLDAAVYAVSPSSAPSSDTDDSYRAAYADGPRNLLAALGGGPSARRLVFVSSTGVYGQTGGEWVYENSPTEPPSVSGRRLLEGEGLVLGGPIPATVLRLGGIYGPGRTSAIERARKAPPDGSPQGTEPPRYTNRIHRDDCAGALAHLLALPDPEPVYLGVDHEPADSRTIAEWLAARPGEDPSASPGVSGDETRARPGRTNKRCSNERLLRSGYEFRYPTFREGFAALLDEAARHS